MDGTTVRSLIAQPQFYSAAAALVLELISPANLNKVGSILNITPIDEIFLLPATFRDLRIVSPVFFEDPAASRTRKCLRKSFFLQTANCPGAPHALRRSLFWG